MPATPTASATPAAAAHHSPTGRLRTRDLVGSRQARPAPQAPHKDHGAGRAGDRAGGPGEHPAEPSPSHHTISAQMIEEANPILTVRRRAIASAMSSCPVAKVV